MIQRYQIANKKMQALCAAACDAKGFVWNIFFGWGSSDNNYGPNYMACSILLFKTYKNCFKKGR